MILCANSANIFHLSEGSLLDDWLVLAKKGVVLLNTIFGDILAELIGIIWPLFLVTFFFVDDAVAWAHAGFDVQVAFFAHFLIFYAQRFKDLVLVWVETLYCASSTMDLLFYSGRLRRLRQLHFKIIRRQHFGQLVCINMNDFEWATQ
jgi:hypothetical protein